jgi:hypothetical protein
MLKNTAYSREICQQLPSGYVSNPGKYHGAVDTYMYTCLPSADNFLCIFIIVTIVCHC